MVTPTAPIESTPTPTNHGTVFPRITIEFCTQCKWMLRAAYFGQELLSTFSTDLGEVALVPRTGGIFTVTMYNQAEGEGNVLWDRKRDGGFPEVKILKSLVRNVIDPTRDLGHTDRALKAVAGGGDGGPKEQSQGQAAQGQSQGSGKECEDCR